jgi:aerobic carbon-monoxide dehydrogenase large subunit
LAKLQKRHQRRFQELIEKGTGVQKFGIGQSVLRMEDDRLLKGAGNYTADRNLPGQAYGLVYRSPFAHAEIKSIDIEEASALNGVLAIYLGEDLEGKIGDMPCIAPIPGKDGNPPAAPKRPVIARGRVRHIGEALAFIVAESLEVARDAAELIDLDLEPIDAVVGVEAAVGEGAPQICPDAPGNISLDWEVGDAAGVAAAFEAAAHTVSLNLVNNRVIPSPIEPRAAIADYRDDAGYTLYAPTQGVFGMKKMLCGMILNEPPERVRVVTGDVGGGFGMKIFLYAEYVMALFAARQLKRPVKWVGDRSEAFVSDTHGRDLVSDVSLAFDEQGKILAYRVETLAAFGSYLSIFAPAVPTVLAVPVLGGVYDIPKIHVSVKGVLTNTPPTDAYRGAGRPEAAYMIERIMNAAADQLGISQDEIRRRNFITPQQMPFTNACGSVFDSGEFERNMNDAMSATKWKGFEGRRANSEKAGRLRGIGMAYYIECTLGDPVEEVRLEFTDGGRVALYVGTQTNGQGHLTTFSQIISERLGISHELIDLIQGDSDLKADGGGTGGSRTLQMIGNASLGACDMVIEKGKRLAAHILEAGEGEVEFEDGLFQLKGTNRSIRLIDMAFDIPEDADMPDGLSVVASYTKSAPTFPNGCHICEVEIDPDTGATKVVDYHVVDDLGVVINPMVVEGQVQGGVVQGIGQALTENCLFEEGSGQLLTGSFMDYGLPRADDLSDIGFSTNEVRCQTNPLGIKGCGEAGTIGAMPALMNAIMDAVAGRGIKNLNMPVTPMKMWQALNRHAAE